jgi:hypothetical protein
MKVQMSAQDFSSDVLQNHVAPKGKPNLRRIRKLNGLLAELGHRGDVRTIIDSTEAAPIRAVLVPYAIIKGVDIRK